jgi:hypothetical protein
MADLGIANIAVQLGEAFPLSLANQIPNLLQILGRTRTEIIQAYHALIQTE